MRYFYYIILNIFISFTVCSASAENANVSFSKNIFEKYAQTYQPFDKIEQKTNPYLIELGKKIFFDTRFSSDSRMSCGTCHLPEKAFSNNDTTAIGNDKKPLHRKTMTLYHIADDTLFFWDGRGTSLEQQVSDALQNPKEMDFSFERAISIMEQDTEYQKLFSDLKQIPTQATISFAVVTYEKSIKPPKTRFDDWLMGDLNALTEQELQGFDIFNTKADCVACHIGNTFKDGIRNDIGLPDKDLGYGAITKNKNDFHMFKTPTLRGISLHAPYMHNGSLKTLEEVIDHYNMQEFKRGDTDIPPPEEQGDVIAFHNFTQPLNLTKSEKKALIAFLKTL
jgi:cytochrome c peroxidase